MITIVKMLSLNDNIDYCFVGSRHDGNISYHTSLPRGQLEESAAMEAAVCGGKFCNVEYPFERYLHFTDSDAILDIQTKSPFYFKCHPASPDVTMSARAFNELQGFVVTDKGATFISRNQKDLSSPPNKIAKLSVELFVVLPEQPQQVASSMDVLPVFAYLKHVKTTKPNAIVWHTRRWIIRDH
ncbi:hypothetical protein G9A89_000495 [Geosiphon pyriformis]|nr:hypothetical protein G9A89_000495 [Geosiphon pyriformis]